MSWREKQKAELNDHLYSTALELFKEQGYDETSVMAICEAAGVAKGTFFNYFPSKEAVLARYMNDITIDGLTRAKANLKGDAERDVKETCRQLFIVAQENEAMFKTVCRVTPQDPSLREEEDKVDDDIVVFLLGIIDEGKQKGQLADELPADVLVPLILSALTATANQWASTPEFNPEVEIERRIDFLFRAAQTYGE